jgi:benzylsuccinate CoA-transferase BbsF subunit
MLEQLMREHPLTEVLAGVRIVDFTWVIAGPMATRMAGGMGAEVIKMETSTRPEFSVRAPWFGAVNTNKLSCTVNIKSPEGQDLVRDLVRQADIVTENFAAGVLERVGLSYDELRTVNPRIIYVSGSGLGRTGPLSDCVAYGSLLQAYCGRASILGEPNERMEGLGLTTAWTDPVTGTWEIAAILLALEERDRTGQGCFVDLSMVEATAALLPEMILAADRAEIDTMMDAEAGAPHGIFRASGHDDWVALSVRDDNEWVGFCHAIGDPKLEQDLRFKDAAGRRRYLAELNEIAASFIRVRASRAAERTLRASGVPASHCADVSDRLAADAAARAPMFPMEAAGQIGIGLGWTDEALGRGRVDPAPSLGEHNDYVFGTLLGKDAAEIARLKETGAII